MAQHNSDSARQTVCLDRRLCVAPMMDWTDRHDRYLLRLITPRALLYTEMVTTGALIHGDRQRFLQFNDEEHPVAFQIGGSEASEMARCAGFAEHAGYDEINMNVGCPSDRVQSGRFGVCLMLEPTRVADCVKAMQDAVTIPVTVKCRIGVDDKDSLEDLYRFVEIIVEAGCRTLIVHARKAWLKGLSPKQNREIPPLQYDYVYALKKVFPQLEIIINGGITNAHQAVSHLKYVDGIMVGREAYQNPFALVDIDKMIYPSSDVTNVCASNRSAVLERYLDYIERQLSNGVYLKHMGRHLLGFFQGRPGARAWRRYLSENMYRKGAGTEVIKQAMTIVQRYQATA